MNFELLPNEIFIECFQYLNTPDILYSFDRLNYRFYTLIRNSPLHLNFQQMRKCLFNEFCQTILSNPEIKQSIIYLKLSNKGTYGQIQSFFSLFSLNEFTHLRSLSLIDINDDNVEQILPILPFLSNLYSFYCTYQGDGILKIIPALSKSQIRILTIPDFKFNFTFLYKTMIITSLTISLCNITDLCHLLLHTPILQYLKIGCLSDNRITKDKLNFTVTNSVHLKEIIVDYSMLNFQILKVLLESTPNLKLFSISAPNEIEMIDANRWQYLIESSLSHLKIFKFKFACLSRDSSDEKFIKLQQFQSEFWHQQHHWYTNYEIDRYSVSIYTMPYTWNEYTLKSSIHRYSHSNEFDNVKKLTIWSREIIHNSGYFFRNVESLRLTSTSINDNELAEYRSSTTEIEFLHIIVNLSNIKKLIITDECYMTSSLLLNILKTLPNVSSLIIAKDTLISFLKNLQLCNYLNRVILSLDISGDCHDKYIRSHEIDLFCKIFSNLEHLQCNIKNLQNLLLILTKCSKLSMIKLGMISEEISSWIQSNVSGLNIYIDFTSIDHEDNDES